MKNSVSRELLVKVLKAATLAMEKQQSPSDLMQPSYRALILIRNDYLALDRADQEKVGKSLAPVLCDLCTVAGAHWEDAQGDEAAQKLYGGAVQVSENLLKVIDADIRPDQTVPRTELGPAWRNDDKPRFDKDHDKWRSVLMGPAYDKKR